MSKSTWSRLALLAVLAAGVAVAIVYRDQLSPALLESSIKQLGVWGPVVFIAIWLVGPTFFVPGGALTLAGGALFGPFWGAVYTLCGATVGATIAFLVSRYVAGDWAERRAGGLMGRVKSGVEAEGWRFVAFTRLVPLFPFNLLNFAFGLTRIPVRTYALTSLVCMAPGTAGYSYLGAFGKDALLGGEGLVRKGLIALAVIAALVFLPMFLRRWWGARGESPAPEREE